MCFIYIGNVLMATCRWNLVRYIGYHYADLERFLFPVYTLCNLDLMHDCLRDIRLDSSIACNSRML